MRGMRMGHCPSVRCLPGHVRRKMLAWPRWVVSRSLSILGSQAATIRKSTFHRIPTKMPFRPVFMRGGAGPACMDDLVEEWGCLSPGQYLIHDRDTKFCAAFQHIIDDAGVERVPLPARSPNLNAYAERWVRSVKDEALSRMILFGENSLWHVLNAYVDHD